MNLSSSVFDELSASLSWRKNFHIVLFFPSLHSPTRISGLFRVKSAHKIKLSDKQLLQWMCPILLIMIIYLACWSAGAPAAPEILENENKLKYPQCAYGWWDHCLVVGKYFLYWWAKIDDKKSLSYYYEIPWLIDTIGRELLRWNLVIEMKSSLKLRQI